MSSAADSADDQSAPTSTGAGEQLGQVFFAFIKALLVGVVVGYLAGAVEGADPAYDPIPGDSGDSGDSMAGLGILLVAILAFLFAGISAFAVFAGSCHANGNVHRWVAGVPPLIAASPVFLYFVAISIVSFAESAGAPLLLLATLAWGSILALASFDILPRWAVVGGFTSLALIAVVLRLTVW